MIARRLGLATALLIASHGPRADADPLRLRADGFFAAQSPVGLVQLQAEDNERDWLSAEALVWAGADELRDDGDGDALVVSLQARDPKGRGNARVGRFVAMTGAILPRHVDGASVRARAGSTTAEAFGGVPVAPRLGASAYDWIAGARVAHSLDGLGTVGLSYVHERARGFLADSEVGADLAATPTRWLDVAARASLDLVDEAALSHALVSAAARRGKWRVEAFGARRSPSRLLPATSLFSALGDVASDEVGLSARWRAAPRLDVWGSASYRDVGGDHGASLLAKSLLRLDDKGEGALMVELRRQDLDDVSSWTGVRGAAQIPLGMLRASTELELVAPDHSHGRGTVWPWALAALTFPAENWEAAAAFEVRSSPESELALSALLRVARRWEIR